MLLVHHVVYQISFSGFKRFFLLSCYSAIIAGALLPYRRWAPVFVPTAAVLSLGDGICAYGGRTGYRCLLLPYVVGGQYLCLPLPYVVGGRYLCLPLPYRRWGTVSVPTAAVLSLGDGICAYRCHTVILLVIFLYNVCAFTEQDCDPLSTFDAFDPTDLPLPCSSSLSPLQKLVNY